MSSSVERDPAAAFYPLPATKRLPFWRRSAGLGSIVGLHAVALLVAFGMANNPELAKPLQTLTMRMLETTPPSPRVEPPKPPPPSPPRKAPLAPPPVMTAAATATAAPSLPSRHSPSRARSRSQQPRPRRQPRRPSLPRASMPTICRTRSPCTRRCRAGRARRARSCCVFGSARRAPR